MGKNGTGGIRTYNLSHVSFRFSAWRQEREEQAWVSKPQSPCPLSLPFHSDLITCDQEGNFARRAAPVVYTLGLAGEGETRSHVTA